MFLLVDIAYLIALPAVIVHALLSRLKGHPRRKDLRGRLGFGKNLPIQPKRILIHAVSVGEVNSLRTIVPLLIENNYDVVICVTTDTGIRRANELFSESCIIERFPFDFSFSIRKFLKRIKPTIVALVELEVWPNFISRCSKISVPVLIINGRLSQRSFERYKLVKPLLKKTFSRISAIGMQTVDYSNRVKDLGGMNVCVLGTMKWDNVDIAFQCVNGVQQFIADLGIDPEKPLVVGASTAPEEHSILRNALPEGVQLLCAPRKPEWFDNAEEVLAPCNRRTCKQRCETNYFLLDTIGELDKAYLYADIVVIGRSFVPMYGSDPVPPIAFGKTTFIGPNYGDFKEMVDLFIKESAIVVCDEKELADCIQLYLEDPELLKAPGLAGQMVIKKQQGASKKYFDLIVENTPSG
ncbi:MAG: glycosyltransferase N-terminal domain-containing protein [Phycisphaerales bacterium]|nr:glycosyltransferase N-terminal domain-containing protein [Phycisphaerales bacterium]